LPVQLATIIDQVRKRSRRDKTQKERAAIVGLVLTPLAGMKPTLFRVGFVVWKSPVTFST
jgi:hypothetical protein